MVRAAVGRFARLMCYNSIPARTRTKSAELFSPTPPFLIINAWFSSEVQISDSGKFNSEGKDESHSALTAFLKSYEFSEAEIEKIVKRCPRIPSSRVSTNLKPKLDYLVECGFRRSALHRVIATEPDILRRSLHNHIKPRYQFLKAYLMGNVDLVIKRSPWLLQQSHVEFCFEYLEKQGVPVECITKFLAGPFNGVGCGKNRLARSVEATKALGIEPADPMFVLYVRLFGSRNETSWRKKLGVFKSLGWSDQDIRATLLRCPLCFEVSEEKLRENMDFYINTVKIERKAIISYPMLLMFSLNGRIVPRYEVMKLLKRHNLLNKFTASTFFGVSEKRFIGRYTKNLEQVPHLLQVYCDSKRAKSDTARLHS